MRQAYSNIPTERKSGEPIRLEEILASRTRRLDDGCLIWTKSCNNGFPRIAINGEVFYAKYVVGLLSGVELGDEHVLRSSCGRKDCVEPSHLVSHMGNDPETYLLGRCDPDPNSGCWLWTGCRKPSGYGNAYLRMGKRRARHTPAHRLSYETFCGPIPPGMHVAHKCDVPPCINPDHLFLATPKENVQDCIRKGRFRTVRRREALKATGASAELCPYQGGCDETGGASESQERESRGGETPTK